MNFYVRKPVVVQAKCFDGSELNAEEIKRWTSGRVEWYQNSEGLFLSVPCSVKPLAVAEPGDWIIKTDDGSLAVLKPEVFESLYVRVES